MIPRTRVFFQDPSSSSLRPPLNFFPLMFPLASPSYTVVSPFHTPYTVLPILINFTKPDGKSGLWQAVRHHEASSKLRRSAIGFLYLSPIIRGASRRERASDWGNGWFRHDMTSTPLCHIIAGGNSRLSNYTASNQALDRADPPDTSQLHFHAVSFSFPSSSREFCSLHVIHIVDLLLFECAV